MVQALEYCRERVLKPGSPLLLTQAFTDRRLQEPVLAVRALLMDLLDIPGEVSEQSVGIAKLQWWQQQLNAPLSVDQHRHPALRAIAETTDITELPAAVTQALIRAIEDLLQRTHYADEQMLWEDCQRAGSVMMALEMRLLNTIQTVELEAAGALHCFLCYLQRIRLNSQHLPWPMPLNLQARYQINQHTWRDQAQRSGLMLRDLLQYISAQIPTLSTLRAGLSAAGQRPAYLRYVLEWRLLQRLTLQPHRLLESLPPRWSPVDAFCLWRAARVTRRLPDVF